MSMQKLGMAAFAVALVVSLAALVLTYTRTHAWSGAMLGAVIVSGIGLAAFARMAR